MSLVQKNPSVVLSKVQRILMTGVSMGALCFIATPEPVFAQSFPQNINPVPSPVLSDLVSKGGVVTHKPRPVNGADGKDADITIIPPKRVEATAGSSGKDGDFFTVNSGSGHSATGSNIFLAGSAGGAGGHGGSAGHFTKGNAAAGGDGGNGGNVGVNSTGDLTVENGSGIVAFSNGGRGGRGGDGSALIDNIKSGAGGNGGHAGQVSVTNIEQIAVTGDQFFGIIAQAAGGHGGKAGDADGDLGKANAAPSGHGGNGGALSIDNKGKISTNGAGSDAIHGLSLGGNGADAAEAKSTFRSATNGVAGSGGHAATVTITNNKIIETHGIHSNGLVGKSVGGKGGNGNNVTPANSVDTATANGGHGGNGGSVTIGNEESITITNGHAIYAESTGGAGGASGSSVTALTKTQSGNGGIGGNAGAINVDNSGYLITKTDSSSAIVAVSTGGLGGSGGTGGHGADVTVTNRGMIITEGDYAAGMIARSLGGNSDITGGAGAVSMSNSGTVLTLGAAADAVTALSQGNRADMVSVVNSGQIIAIGEQSAGISAQSLGKEASGNVSISNMGNVMVAGDGANALVARSDVVRNAENTAVASAFTADMLPFDISASDMIGASNVAGNVSVNHSGNLIAVGAGSSAIWAQSSGTTNGNIDIVVHENSLLIGTAAGVTLIDGDKNSLVSDGVITGMGNTIGYIAGTDGQLLAAGWIDGMAVQGTTGNTTVLNTGLMAGNIDLGSGRNIFTNAQDAWLVSGSLIGLGGRDGSNFINDGILAPGGSTVTQTTQIDGNLVQTTNGRYLVGLNFAGGNTTGDAMVARSAAASSTAAASGSADRLNVSGSANLGGSMALSIINNGYAKSGRNDYVALYAEGGVHDDGMRLLAPNTAVATYTLEYTATEMVLAANIDYAAKGLTENGIAVGHKINAIQFDQASPAFRPLAEAIFAQADIASLQTTYDLIDGEGTAGVQQSYFSETNAFIGTISQQINLWSNPYRRTATTTGQDRNCILKDNICMQSRWRGWYSGFGSDVSVDGDPYWVGSGDLSSHSKGMAAGFDYELDRNMLLGLAVGIGQTNFNVHDRMTKGELQTGRTALYGAYQQNNFYVDGLVGVDWFDAATQRVAQIAATDVTTGFNDRLQNDFSGYGINMRLEAGYRTDLGGVQVTPFAALQLSSFHMNSSTERADTTGGELALYYKNRTVNSVPLSLGAQLDTQLELGKNVTAAPYIRAAWMHEFSNKRSVEAGFIAAPGYDFIVHGAAQARNSAQLEAGINVQIDTGLSLYGKVTGNFSGSAQDVSGSGGFRLRW